MAARVEGVGGTPWRSELSITNRDVVPLRLEVTYQPRSDRVLRTEYRMDPFETLLFNDLVTSMFGAASGKGPVRIRPLDGGVAPALVSRTLAEWPRGNVGQAMPGIYQPRAGLVYVPGLRHDETYRSNVGVTADTGAAVRAVFSLYRGFDGMVASGVARSIPAGCNLQWSIEDLFPGTARSDVPMTVAVELPNPAVAYGSLVDNVSGDAVTIVAKVPTWEWIVPAVAHVRGRDGTFWSSSVSITNTSLSSAMVTLEYLPEATDNSNGGPERPPMQFGPGDSAEFKDILGKSFGIYNGKGALAIRSTRPLVASSRVFTASPSGGTIGHGLETVAADRLSPDERVLPGVRTEGGFRTNVGIVAGAVEARVRCRLRDHDGSELGEVYVTVPARSMKQWEVLSLFGQDLEHAPSPVGSLVVDAPDDFLAYLVVVDGSSQDPVLFLPEQ